MKLRRYVKRSTRYPIAPCQFFLPLLREAVRQPVSRMEVHSPQTPPSPFLCPLTVSASVPRIFKDAAGYDVYKRLTREHLVTIFGSHFRLLPPTTVLLQKLWRTRLHVRSGDFRRWNCSKSGGWRLRQVRTASSPSRRYCVSSLYSCLCVLLLSRSTSRDGFRRGSAESG